MNASPIRPGFSALTPWLVVEGAHELILFLERVFGARVVERLERTDGTAAHVVMDLDGSRLELAETDDERPVRQAALHYYVHDVEQVFEAATTAGAQVLFRPREDERGEEIAAVEDPRGNHWFIARWQGGVSRKEWREREQEEASETPESDEVAAQEEAGPDRQRKGA